MDEPFTNPTNYSTDASTSPAPLVPEQKPAPPLHSIFVGPNGLRAGWRFAIYLAAFFALLTLLSYAQYAQESRRSHYGLALVFFALATFCWVILIEHGPENFLEGTQIELENAISMLKLPR